jgi:hypothetical protein
VTDLLARWKSYGDVHAVQGIDLLVARRQIAVRFFSWEPRG